MFKYIKKLLRSLNANTHPGELAHAFAIGFMIGFIPKDNLWWIFLCVFFVFLRINRGLLFFTTLLGSVIAPSLDPLFDTIGYMVLTHPALAPTFEMLLEIPFIAYTNFNDTIVMGSSCFSVLVYIPLYILGRVLVRLWRSSLLPKFVDLPLVKKLTSIFNIKSAIDFFN